MLRIAELKHVMSRIGDPLKTEEMKEFIETVDMNKDGYIRIEDLVQLLEPQTDRGSLLAKSVN